MFPPSNAPSEQFPYRIEEEIGRGSMGMVYRAVETALDRPVAIKAMLPSLLEVEGQERQSEVRRRFLQEARAAAALSHPGITTVYRVGEENGVPYLVMEWLSGRNLEEILAVQGPLEPEPAMRLILALLDALETAHRAGVVHRDVKPSNLMLLEDGRLKVTDFGIARLQGRELVQTQAGVVLATPTFASPEQLQGGEIDGRADLFASGILLYHLLSKRFPFAGKTFLELASSVLHQPAISISEYVPDLPPALEAVIDRALRKRREERFQSAGEMAQRLRGVLGEGTVEAAPKLDIAAAQQPRSISGLPVDAAQAVARTVSSWPSKSLDRQPTQQLLDRLLEKPLHAEAFSGAAMIDHICFLVHDGLLLGAVDSLGGRQGDAAVESLPAETQPILYPVPEGLPRSIVPLLSSLLSPPRVRQGDLDTSFINLPAMAQKLKEERFDGILRLRRGQATGWILFAAGSHVLSLYSQGWEDVPVDQSWQHWVSRFPLKASIEERTCVPLGLWYRRAYRSFAVDVEAINADDTAADADRTLSTRTRLLLQSSRSGTLRASKVHLRAQPSQQQPPGTSVQAGYQDAPMFRFLRWALDELPIFFAERERTARWKYLVEWLYEIRKAHLYHELARPGTRETDRFDLVTADASGKVLHLAQRSVRLNAQSFRTHLDGFVAAKKSRRKTGDVGAAFLLAPSFDEETLAAYGEAVKQATGSSWFGMEESFTGYEGFIRIGPRRGFHLLLVEERGDRFEPLVLS